MIVVYEKALLDTFKKRMEKLAKIADRLDVPAPTYEVIKEFTKKSSDDPGVVIRYVKIRIDGDEPKFDGWVFKTRFDHVNKITTGRESPAGYSVDVCKCDHCGQNRDRNATYIISHSNGDIKQVGGSCLKHYLGHALPVNLSSFYDELEEIDRESYGSSGQYEYEIRTVIKCCLYFVKYHGYEKEGGTKQRFLGALHGRNMPWLKINDEITDENVDEIINEIKNLEPVSDYNRNLLSLVNQESTIGRYVGFVCAMIPTALYQIEKRLEENSPKLVSEYVGEVSKRYKKVRVKVTNVSHFDSDFGVKTMIKFITEAGNVMIWWASGYFEKEQLINKDVDLTFTVKSHEQYKGTKQTVLSRCKIEDIE